MKEKFNPTLIKTHLASVSPVTMRVTHFSLKYSTESDQQHTRNSLLFRTTAIRAAGIVYLRED